MTETITEFNVYKLKQELLNKFRYGFNSLDNKSRITETTTTFNGDGATTKFILSPTNMAYVKSVSVAGTLLAFGSGWDIHWRGTDKGKVEIYIAPVIGVDNISIVWGNTSGNSNFVWSDFPKENLGIHSYPRIGFKTTIRTNVAGMCGKAHTLKNEILVQIKIVDTDVFEVDYLTAECSDWLKANAKNFYYFNFITPQSYNEFDNYDDNTEITHYKMIEFVIPEKIEKVQYT